MSLTLFSLELSSANCDPLLYVFVTSLDQDNINSISNYQYPNYRDDDTLIAYSIKIINDDNCTYPESILTTKLIEPNTEEIPFCDSIKIPPIGPNNTLLLNLSDLKESNNFFLNGWRYKCAARLEEPGTWSFDLALDPINRTAYSTGNGYDLIHVQGTRSGNKFKVYSKITFIELESLQKSLWIGGIISIVSAIIGALLTLLTEYLLNKYRENLRKKVALSLLITELKSNIKFANDLEENKSLYLNKKQLPFIDFNKLNLEKIISGDYINDSKIVDLLFNYYQLLSSMNSCIHRMRQGFVIPSEFNDMQKVIAHIPEHNSYAKHIIKQLRDKIK